MGNDQMKQMKDVQIDEFIERKICIGLIVSTDYIREVFLHWSSNLLESSFARVLSSWCFDYFNQYGKAPKQDIESIYTAKLKTGLSKDIAEAIDLLLRSLSNEYERSQFNLQYLLDQTKAYLRQRNLLQHTEKIQEAIKEGNITEAENLAFGYSSVAIQNNQSIDPFSQDIRSQVKAAFQERGIPLIRFSKALGDMMNRELVRGAFIAFMGAEKRGKSFLLIDLALRAVRSGSNVVFFQAGDMTEAQQLRRISIYLAKRSDEVRYCKGMWIPTIDCLLHQTDECEIENREEIIDRIFKPKEEITYDNLVQAAMHFKDHKTCRNCDRLVGTPWLEWRPETQPLTWQQAYKVLRLFGKKFGSRFHLSTYPNEMLNIAEIKSLLSAWERRDGFVPDVIIIDYADILAPDPDFSRVDFRQQQGKIWQRLRSLSEEKHCLVITATQIKAAGYKKDLLSMADFSEDKRKFAHVTAMYGLNQTPEEKRIGVMRINELVVREADFDSLRPVTVLQRLQIGRPVLGSYR